MKEKIKKERIGKIKITKEEALDFLERIAKGEIKPKDKEEKELLEYITSQVKEGLTPGEEKEITLPAVKESILTLKDKKEIMKWTPPKREYTELPLAIVNARELTEYQEGDNGSLIEEYYQKGIPFLVSPLGPLTHTGKIIFYGIMPNLTRELRGMSITKVNDYGTIVKARLKRGGKTYDLVNEEYRKIALMQYYDPSIFTDEEGTGKTYYDTKKTPLFFYTEDIKEKGRKGKDRIFSRNPILKSIKLWNQLAGYRLDNILEATNKHELSLYIFLETKLKKEKEYFHIGEDKLISYADIHAKEKIHQRRDLKIALENLEEDYHILYGKNKNNHYFFNRPGGPISKEERDQIVKLLNQGKTPTGKNIMEQWRKDQEEKERTRKEEAQLYTRKQRIQATLIDWHIKLNRIKEITDHYETDYLERMIKKVKSKNPKNPAGLFLRIIKNY